MLKRKLVQILIITLFIAGIGLSLIYLAHFTTTPPTPAPQIPPVVEPVISQQVDSFEECVEATNLVFTTNPSKCIAPDGQVFVNPTAYEGRVITEVEKVE